jgi:hypothetical protein
VQISLGGKSPLFHLAVVPLAMATQMMGSIVVVEIRESSTPRSAMLW